MQLKPITTIIVLSLVVASLSVAGCTVGLPSTSSPTPTPTPIVATSTPTQTPTTSVAPTHNAVLERFVMAQMDYAAQNGTIRAWQVTWPGSNEVNIQAATHREEPSATAYMNRTVTIFPSTEAATVYLHSYNLTGHALSYTAYPSSGPTEIALGHQPTMFKVYEKVSDELKIHYSSQVEQADNLILVSAISTTPY